MSTHGKTFMNAIIGAVVTTILSFLPLSPTLGGFASGYLQGGELRRGAWVGGLSGLFALLPIFLALVFVVPLFVIAPFGVPNLPFNASLYSSALFLLVGFYTIVFGILGGVIGSYIQNAVGQ